MLRIPNTYQKNVETGWLNQFRNFCPQLWGKTCREILKPRAQFLWILSIKTLAVLWRKMLLCSDQPPVMGERWQVELQDLQDPPGLLTPI